MKLIIFLLTILLTAPSMAQNTIWQLGEIDHDYQEFAMAEEDYRKYKKDAFFVVGVSDPATDWPYMHPGPGDGWAGNRDHTFSLIFGLSKTSSVGVVKLIINMVDTHNGNPGKVKIRINNFELEQKLPNGGGDESIYGDPEKGKPYECVFEIPMDELRKGNNSLDIIKDDASWFLYDALRMEAAKGIKQVAVEDFIEVGGLRFEPGVFKGKNGNQQNLSVEIKYAGPEKKVEWRDNISEGSEFKLKPGIQRIKMSIPEIQTEKNYSCSIKDGRKTLAEFSEILKPDKHLTVYILPHSHTDIGYTDVQTVIEDRQVENLKTGIQYAMETADYPEGSQFVWNIEVGWAADLYMSRLGEKDKQLFLDALSKGWISLDGMYLNELTGLCRPEELLRLFRYGTKLAEETGATVDAAMISDVPGYTWGTVTAMAQAGIKYFSVAPNYFDRIGDILVEWENKPFYWLSPSGKEKVLVWIPYKGYAWSHTINELNEVHATSFLKELDDMDYPYDIAYMRWSGHGDNAVPEKQISDFARDWNEKHVWPRFVISSTGEAFRAFEEKYGDQLEEYSGDWTPYWEDGAGSSAEETAMNRNTSDRLTQAEALYAMTPESDYPVEEFEKAWVNTLLYSEHTWGAWCSITDPENQLTIDQWDIKKGYAENAARMSRDLLYENLNTGSGGLIEVINTTGWKRSELVKVYSEHYPDFKSVIRGKGKTYPVQKLSDGNMVFFAEDIPALSSYRFTSTMEEAKHEAKYPAATISDDWIMDNGLVKVQIDPKSGDIISLKGINPDINYADLSSGEALNQYLYFEGRDLANLESSGKAEIRILEPGPIYAVVEVVSDAPGCHKLIRKYSLAMGQDYLEIENIVDKKRAPMPEAIGDWYLAQNENKESVNFAFPFNVPDGTMRLDLPIGSMIPWEDQIPSACKNWYTVGRYADISNQNIGVSWFTIDAPLVEVGEISATLVGSQSDPEVWRKVVQPTQKLYSWAMNNHWGTNYRQYQEGPVVFRYALRPHNVYDAAETYRLATGLTQPLLINRTKRTDGALCPSSMAPLKITSKNIVLISLKPADDGKGFIARLYNPGLETAKGFVDAMGKKLYLSNTAEHKISEIGSEVTLVGMELMTVRVE